MTVSLTTVNATEGLREFKKETPRAPVKPDPSISRVPLIGPVVAATPPTLTPVMVAVPFDVN